MNSFHRNLHLLWPCFGSHNAPREMKPRHNVYCAAATQQRPKLKFRVTYATLSQSRSCQRSTGNNLLCCCCSAAVDPAWLSLPAVVVAGLNGVLKVRAELHAEGPEEPLQWHAAAQEGEGS